MRSKAAVGRQSSAIGWGLAAGLLLIAAPGYVFAEPELVDRIVAIVDRDVILLSEAEQAMFLAAAGRDDDASLRDVVEQLIEASLIEREVARFTDAPVPKELIEAQIERIRARFALSDDFDAMLVERGLDEEELRAEVTRQLTVSRYLERRFRALTYVTDDDIETYYSTQVVPGLRDEREPTLEEIDQIRRILEEQRFNDRVEQWIDGLKDRARIRRYVW